MRRYLAAMASRKGLAPQVMAYWLRSASMAWAAALFSAAGAGKSGKPCARLMAPWRTARRVISRMTDSVNRAIRWLRNRARRTDEVDDTIRGYFAGRAACKWWGRRGTLWVRLLTAGSIKGWQAEAPAPQSTSIGDQIDLPDPAVDFDPDLVRGAAVGRADPVSVLLPEPADLD